MEKNRAGFVNVKVGDRIAQAILCEYKTMGVDNVKDVDRTAGFGSTGKE